MGSSQMPKRPDAARTMRVTAIVRSLRALKNRRARVCTRGYRNACGKIRSIDADGLSVWGMVRAIPTFCFVLEVAAPGLLVVKHHRNDPGKFVNVAVLEGDQIKIVDEQASKQPDCPSLLDSLLGFGKPSESVL